MLTASKSTLKPDQIERLSNLLKTLTTTYGGEDTRLEDLELVHSFMEWLIGYVKAQGKTQ